MPDTIEAIQHDLTELTARVKRLEGLSGDRHGALEREMRAGFAGVGARFDGLESELRFRYEQLDRIEEALTALTTKVEKLSTFIHGHLNGKGATE